MPASLRVRFWSLLALALCAPARAQTPSPLAEWQYSAGWVLFPYFTTDTPEWQRTVGLAVETTPHYEGARDAHAMGGFIADWRYKDVAFFSTVEGVGVNLWRGKGHRGGASITYDLGRREPDDAALHGMGNIRPAPETKLFAEKVFFPLVLRADARYALGGHSGWTGDFGAYMPVAGSRIFFLLVGPSVTFVDAVNMRHSFGVNTDQASRSGYAVYDPAGGVRDARFGFIANRLFGDHWVLSVAGAGERLLGNAEKSPLAQRHWQSTGNLSVNYRW